MPIAGSFGAASARAWNAGKQFSFVGIRGQNLTGPGTHPAVPWPTGSRVGDYAVIAYFPGRTLSGGSPTPWNAANTMSGRVLLAHRALEALDLSSPPTFNDETPIAVCVYRGGKNITADRTSVSFSGSSTSMTGFAKSSNHGACIGFVHGTGDQSFLSLSDTAGVDWRASAGGGVNAWFLNMYCMENPSQYIDGSLFAVLASVASGSKYASVLEILR